MKTVFCAIHTGKKLEKGRLGPLKGNRPFMTGLVHAHVITRPVCPLSGMTFGAEREFVFSPAITPVSAQINQFQSQLQR
jgi:hypothetical protein